MRRIASNFVGKSIIQTSRLRGNGGSALPGLVIEKIYPQYLHKTASKIPEGSIIVTGTNGKTTTAKILSDMLVANGKTVIANRAGSNMNRGIISTLLEHSKLSGGISGDIALFEVDEAFVAQVARQIRPRAIVVLNLLRDQLDRYGELDRTAELIGAGLGYAQHVVLNADDPLVAGLAKQAKNAQVHYFGASAQIQKHLPDDSSLFGANHKPKRTKQARNDVSLQWAKSSEDGQQLGYIVAGKTYQSKFALDGIYNAYNAAAALCAAYALGLDVDLASNALSSVRPAFGRTETIELNGKRLQLLLVKNPSGFNQIINTFLTTNDSLPVMIAINDNIADGRDVSWLWDVDFERLEGKSHSILCSGIRGLDLAVRLKYAEVGSSQQNDLRKALERFIETIPKGKTGYIVPTYTAMLSLRRLLSKHTKLNEVWE